MRSDYGSDSPLKKHVEMTDMVFFDDSPTNPNRNTLRVVDIDRRQRKSSFSKYYEVDRGSVESVEKLDIAPEEKRKMIFEGRVRRPKANGAYEWIYLKLKQAVLYIYENEIMERCQNTIKIEDIKEVVCPDPKKSSLYIIFSSLSRDKKLKIKCQTPEESSRWIFSIQSEMKRLSNDRKMKTKSLKIREKNHRKLIIDYE